jgi:hypothetical protein
MAVQGSFKKKYVSEEETPFVKHAFLQQQDWGHVCAGNQFSFISVIGQGYETKESHTTRA